MSERQRDGRAANSGAAEERQKNSSRATRRRASKVPLRTTENYRRSVSTRLVVRPGGEAGERTRRRARLCRGEQCAEGGFMLFHAVSCACAAASNAPRAECSNRHVTDM